MPVTPGTENIKLVSKLNNPAINFAKASNKMLNQVTAVVPQSNLFGHQSKPTLKYGKCEVVHAATL